MIRCKCAARLRWRSHCCDAIRKKILGFSTTFAAFRDLTDNDPMKVSFKKAWQPPVHDVDGPTCSCVEKTNFIGFPSSSIEPWWENIFSLTWKFRFKEALVLRVVKSYKWINMFSLFSVQIFIFHGNHEFAKNFVAVECVKFFRELCLVQKKQKFFQITHVSCFGKMFFESSLSRGL